MHEWVIPMSCVRIYVIHLLGIYVTIICNWLIFWQNALYLKLGRSKIFLILQEIRFQDQVLNSSSLSKKQVEKCKFIKTRQLHLSSLKKLFQPSVLDTCSTASICQGLKKQKLCYNFLEFMNVSLGLLFY